MNSEPSWLLTQCFSPHTFRPPPEDSTPYRWLSFLPVTQRPPCRSTPSLQPDIFQGIRRPSHHVVLSCLFSMVTPRGSPATWRPPFRHPAVLLALLKAHSAFLAGQCLSGSRSSVPWPLPTRSLGSFLPSRSPSDRSVLPRHSEPSQLLDTLMLVPLFALPASLCHFAHATLSRALGISEPLCAIIAA